MTTQTTRSFQLNTIYQTTTIFSQFEDFSGLQECDVQTATAGSSTIARKICHGGGKNDKIASSTCSAKILHVMGTGLNPLRVSRPRINH